MINRYAVIGLTAGITHSCSHSIACIPTGWSLSEEQPPTSLTCFSDVWLRELISNGNDALEKFRLTSLTKRGFGNNDPLNITIKAVQDEDGNGGKIIVTGKFHRDRV